MGSRQDRGLERGEMALFDKISTKCIAALQWIGPHLKEEHLCSISNTLDFSQEVCEHTQFEGEVEYVDSSQVGCVADNLSF